MLKNIRYHRQFLYCCLIFTLFSSAWLPSQADASPLSLNEQIEHWRLQLQKDPAFASWQEASWEKFSLGPNTHQWLIIFQQKKGVVGYMLVGVKQSLSEKQDASPWVLLEYGLGEHPLFSSTLQSPPWEKKQQKEQEQRIIYYYQGLESLLILPQSSRKQRYYDGKRDEEYPAEWFRKLDLSKSKGIPSTIRDDVQLLTWFTQEVVEGDPFFADPFYSIYWAQDDERMAIHDEEELLSLIQDGERPRITYVTQLYRNMLLAPYRISAYHHWSTGESFIALEDEGKRYLSYSYLLQLGGSFFIEIEKKSE